MSLDRRIRDELAHDANRVEIDVERNLREVEARARRRSRIGSLAPVAASALVVLAIALRFGFGPPPIGRPDHSPSAGPPSAGPPSPSPSSGPVCPIGRGQCLGPLQPGTYTSRGFKPAVTFTVPQGWENTLDSLWQLDLQYDAGGQYTYPDSTTFHDGISIFRGPIAMSSASANAVAGVGTSAHDLGLWLNTHQDLVASGLAPVTVSGVGGYRILLSLPSGPRTAPDHCTTDHQEPRCESLFSGDATGGKYSFGLVGPESTLIYLLDIPGGVTVMVVIDDVDGVDASGLVAASTPVVERLTFDTTGAPSSTP